MRDLPGGFRQHCLLGTNVLGEIDDWGRGTDRRQPEVMQRTNSRVGKLVRLVESVNIPSSSIAMVATTRCDQAYEDELVVEPVECSLPGGLIAVPSVVKARVGRCAILTPEKSQWCSSNGLWWERFARPTFLSYHKSTVHLLLGRSVCGITSNS
ncbi:hypothetical protein RRG08_012481 [Elysia crispata]|uniref:Uncharacterized protein n=1 Tax=Elysia crispata TaxID=231223 RepID=A0AAE1E1W2_9GAST|nr:hypothetical protein RRG08_012481 [Elysia crispata]